MQKRWAPLKNLAIQGKTVAMQRKEQKKRDMTPRDSSEKIYDGIIILSKKLWKNEKNQHLISIK